MIFILVSVAHIADTAFKNNRVQIFVANQHNKGFNFSKKKSLTKLRTEAPNDA